MSIATDAKAYADAAVEQGKQALSQAQTVAAQAYAELRAKSDALLTSAKNGEVKGLDADTVNAVKSRVAPLVNQAKGLGDAFADKADELIKDPRVAKAVSGVEAVATTVHERLVQPALIRAGFGPVAEQAKAAKKPANTKPAETKPASTPAPTAARKTTGATLHAVKPTKSTPRKSASTKPPTGEN